MKNFRLIAFTLLTLLVSLSLEAQSIERKEREKKDYRDALITTGAVFSNIQLYFIDTISLSKVNDIALNAMLTRLDPYTQYMDEKNAKSFMEATDGAYAGIGAIISQRDGGKVVVNELLEGLPADKAGLKPGDYFLTIDGKDFSKSTTPEVSAALRGHEGTDIEVVVQRKKHPQPLTFRFKRKNIAISSVSFAGRLKGNIGIVRLSSFTRETGKDLKKELAALQEKGPLEGLILDLRSNGGGVLQSAVEVLSYFVPQGTNVVQVRGRIKESNADYRTSAQPIAPDVPLVVLINEESASASEIVAGALQDVDRAVVMGHKSYGKGLVQSTVPLPKGGLLKLTTAQYFTPSGRNIQKITYNHFNEQPLEEKTTTDSLGSPYYTLAGRTVYAADGILPDLETTVEKLPAIIGYIAIDTLLTDYIEEYVATQPKPSSAKALTLSEEEYGKFSDFLVKKGFEYKPASSQMLDRLQEIFEAEGKAPYTKEQLNALRKVAEPSVATELKRYKKEIKNYLEQALALRYFYRRGFFERLIPQDTEVKEAEALLREHDRYLQILRPQKKKSQEKPKGSLLNQHS